MSEALTPPARTIDPRGQRFGAGGSVVILVVAFVTGQLWIASLAGLNLLIASAFGSRLFMRPGVAERRPVLPNGGRIVTMGVPAPVSVTMPAPIATTRHATASRSAASSRAETWAAPLHRDRR